MASEKSKKILHKNQSESEVEEREHELNKIEVKKSEKKRKKLKKDIYFEQEEVIIPVVEISKAENTRDVKKKHKKQKKSKTGDECAVESDEESNAEKTQ